MIAIFQHNCYILDWNSL